MKFGECLENVHSKMPLIHNITNYVTVNDVANVLLACGGSPIMADESEEVEDITSICGGLNINIGTLNRHTIPAMFKAGKKANELGHPVLLDPVGVGASSLRTDTAKQLLEEIHFSVIRGNISEIKTLAAGSGSTRGVDADVAECRDRGESERSGRLCEKFRKGSGKYRCSYRCDRSGQRWRTLLCHTQWQGTDGKDHRNRMPVVRTDDSIHYGKSKAYVKCGSSGSLCDGSCRRDRICPSAKP